LVRILPAYTATPIEPLSRSRERVVEDRVRALFAATSIAA
jgi:hypothetical protein